MQEDAMEFKMRLNKMPETISRNSVAKKCYIRFNTLDIVCYVVKSRLS